MVLDHRGREITAPTPTSRRRDGLPAKLDKLRSDFQTELATIKRENEQLQRENTMGGLSGLVGCFSGQGFNGNGYSTTGQPYTIALANNYTPISLNRVLLSYAYMTQGLIQTFVDVPVEDAFRGGVNFKSDELDEVDLKKLNQTFKRQRSAYAGRGTGLGRVNMQAGYNFANSDLKANKLGQCWKRLFGGAGLIINTDQDFRKELNVDRIREDSPLTFIAADRWELVLTGINVNDITNPTPFNYYGLDLNASRVMKLIGKEAPSYVRLRLQGWGMSVLEYTIRAFNAYLKFESLLFELLDEAKVDVWKITNFNTSLASDKATDAIRRRLMLGNELKNYQNGIAMDKNDDYDQKQISFTGIPDIKTGLQADLCAYMRFPRNKLFGESAGGFGSGKDSLDNYNSTVEAIREDATPELVVTGALRCQQMFGFIPEDLEPEFTPLDVLDGTEQEAIKTSKQNRGIQLFTTGLADGKESSEILKKEGLLTIDTAVLKGLREPEPPLTQNPDEVEGAQKHEEKMAKAKPAAGDRGNGRR